MTDDGDTSRSSRGSRARAATRSTGRSPRPATPSSRCSASTRYRPAGLTVGRGPDRRRRHRRPAQRRHDRPCATDRGRTTPRPSWRRTARFSERTRYLRYFSPYPRIPERDLHRFVNVDHRDREAFVVEVGGRIVAIGRYDRLGPDAADAEVAFVVEDAYQGRGIGPVLMEHLAAAARDAGHHPVRRRGAAGQRDDAAGLRRLRVRGRAPVRRRRRAPRLPHRADGEFAGGAVAARAPHRGAVDRPAARAARRRRVRRQRQRSRRRRGGARPPA